MKWAWIYHKPVTVASSLLSHLFSKTLTHPCPPWLPSSFLEPGFRKTSHKTISHARLSPKNLCTSVEQCFPGTCQGRWAHRSDKGMSSRSDRSASPRATQTIPPAMTPEPSGEQTSSPLGPQATGQAGAGLTGPALTQGLHIKRNPARTPLMKWESKERDTQTSGREVSTPPRL